MLVRLFCFFVVFAFGEAGFIYAQKKVSPVNTVVPGDLMPVQTDGLSKTRHTVRIGGQTIAYTATAGYMKMKDENDSLKANLFYIAYTREGVSDPSKRPILFSFNGGPGSSSVWLHMGLLGPQRVVMQDDGTHLPPPYQYTENEWSWLDEADLVFIDPMLTGYTRPAGKTPKEEFTGYENDVRFVGDFIRLYLTRAQRWSSPKYIIGESYGTTRAAGLSGYLQDRHGIFVNGIILVSAVLDFLSQDETPGNDLPYPLQLPTFAATAWYHKQLDARFQSLPALLKEVEAFCLDEYAPALFKGDRLPADKRKNLIEKLHQYTGLSRDYIEQINLRPTVGRFNKELLRKQGYTVGRLDSRFKGRDINQAGESFEYDPSYNTTIQGAYTTAFNDWIRRHLKYENDLPYEILSGRPRPWTYSVNQALNVSETLWGAMNRNPELKVWICNGYYDMATPYFSTDYVVNHMFLYPERKKNISQTFYEAGHMMYIAKPVLIQMKQDFLNWMKQP